MAYLKTSDSCKAGLNPSETMMLKLNKICNVRPSSLIKITLKPNDSYLIIGRPSKLETMFAKLNKAFGLPRTSYSQTSYDTCDT